MDDNLYKGIMALCQQNQQLANTTTSATDYYNKIVNKYFNVGLWKGIAKEFIRNNKLTVEATSADYVMPSIDANNVDGISNSKVTTVGVGLGLSLGGSAIKNTLSLVDKALVLYKLKHDGFDDFRNIATINEGRQRLKDFSKKVETIKRNCNHMTNSLEKAISSLKNANKNVGDAQKKIEGQVYATKDSNLKEIKARRTEIAYLQLCLNDALKLVKIIKYNLDLLI